MTLQGSVSLSLLDASVIWGEPTSTQLQVGILAEWSALWKHCLILHKSDHPSDAYLRLGAAGSIQITAIPRPWGQLAGLLHLDHFGLLNLQGARRILTCWTSSQVKCN